MPQPQEPSRGQALPFLDRAGRHTTEPPPSVDAMTTGRLACVSERPVVSDRSSADQAEDEVELGAELYLDYLRKTLDCLLS